MQRMPEILRLSWAHVGMFTAALQSMCMYLHVTFGNKDVHNYKHDTCKATVCETLRQRMAKGCELGTKVRHHLAFVKVCRPETAKEADMICLSIYLSIYPFFYGATLSLSLYIYISISIYLSIYLFTCLSIYLYLSVYLSICLLLYLYIYLSIYPSISLSLSVSLSLSLSQSQPPRWVPVSIYLSNYLSLSLSLSLSHPARWVPGTNVIGTSSVQKIRHSQSSMSVNSARKLSAVMPK